MIKVLITDDSAFMRKVLKDMLSSDPDINVVGTARDGLDCLKLAKELSPDVITMDLQMPNMDGITALIKLMDEQPTPVIMVSGVAQRDSDITMAALSAGAVDFIAKPSGEISIDLSKIQNELIEKIKSAYKAHIKKFVHVAPKKQFFTPTSQKIIVVASSTGGPGTLEQIFTELPDSMPVPVLVVQHMPPGFTKSFAERLDTMCQVRVKEAVEGEEIKAGMIYIAPGDFHMELRRIGNKDIIALNQAPRLLGVRPCADIMMKSVAEIYKDKTIGVVLTGMGNDGTEGAKRIKELGGTIIVEAEQSCVIYGMPKSVVDHGYYDEIVELPKIAIAMTQLMEL